MSHEFAFPVTRWLLKSWFLLSAFVFAYLFWVDVFVHRWFVGVWVLFSLVSQGFVGAIVGSLIRPTKWLSVSSPADAFHLLGWDNLSHFLPELIVGAVLFSLSMTVGAAMRATLYWNATTGEVPKGFRSEDLPQVAAPRPFTALPGVSA